MQFQRDQRQIFSIRKFKAYGAASVLLGLMTLGVNDKALAEQIAKAQGTPDSGEATQGTSPTTSDTLETESLLITQADAQVPTTPAQADKAPEAPVAPSVEAVAPQASYAKQLETARQKALKELEALKGDLDHDSYTSYSNQIKAATDTDAFDRILKRAKAKAEEHKAATKLANPAKPASSEPVQAEATDALAAEDTSNLSYKERLASARAKALSQLDALKADLSA
ncbi:YSIRK-type signal peptide-containing protein, partial [Streptococcus pluranimalium]|uniref:YSIRK-type signal peptide-containing protein n=1 Tax=Streptococcus pluranimalium TaxID=82348 RepID=UPI0039FC9EA1